MVADLLKKGRTSVKRMCLKRRVLPMTPMCSWITLAASTSILSWSFPKERMVHIVESKTDGTFMEDLKLLLPTGGDLGAC